jgi:hypothetical protein
MIKLPEIEFAREHFVQCREHPGPDRAAYAVCRCVMRGAAIGMHKEPTPERYGYVLCTDCYANPEVGQWVTACPKCVEYNLLSQPVIFVPDPCVAELSLAEREGWAEFHRRVKKCMPVPPANPYKGLLAWAWDMGWRCGVAQFNQRTMGAAA